MVPITRLFSLDYSHTRFDRDLDPWHVVSLEGSRRSAAATLVARGSFARRFGETGQQVELDAYPRLTSRTYAFLSAGYSPSEIFPTWRYGAELYGDAGGGLELSAGFRRLEFRHVDVALYSASVGKYAGHYYGSLRPTLAWTRGRADLSGDLLVRRYLRDDSEYVTLRFGGGRAAAETITAVELERLSSIRAGLDGVVALGGPLGLRWSVLTEREELPTNRARGRVGVGLGLQTRF